MISMKVTATKVHIRMLLLKRGVRNSRKTRKRGTPFPSYTATGEEEEENDGYGRNLGKFIT